MKKSKRLEQVVLAAGEVRQNFSDVVGKVEYGKERVVVSRNGRKAAAVVPIEDLDLLEALEDKIDLDEARASLKEAKRLGTIPLAKLKKQLGL